MGKRLNELRARVKKLERRVEALLGSLSPKKAKEKGKALGGKKVKKSTKAGRAKVARTATNGRSKARSRVKKEAPEKAPVVEQPVDEVV